MRYVFSCLAAMLFLSCCGASKPGEVVPASAIADTFFTIEDAEKILGQSVYATERNISEGEGAASYKSAYKANQPDAAEKTGNVYYMLEVYSDADAAHKQYKDMKRSNQDNGILLLDGLGDEAYFHSDNVNFYFILVRKGERMMRMKVNRITSYTSLDAFHAVAKNITGRM